MMHACSRSRDVSKARFIQQPGGKSGPVQRFNADGLALTRAAKPKKAKSVRPPADPDALAAEWEAMKSSLGFDVNEVLE